MEHPVLLYDGVCGLCNRTVQFVLRYDREKIFRFAPLQSAYAATLLGKSGVDASDLNSFYIMVFQKDGEVLLKMFGCLVVCAGETPGYVACCGGDFAVDSAHDTRWVIPAHCKEPISVVWEV